MAWIPGESTRTPEAVVVPFSDPSRPAWRVVVTIDREVGKATDQELAFGAADLFGDGVVTRTRDVALTFERADDGSSPLPQSLVNRFPVKRVIEQAKRIAQDYEYDLLDDLPPLPRGGPPRKAADGWYREFGRAVSLWRSYAGFESMNAVHREVARRKRVNETTAKGWWQKGKALLEADAPHIPAAVATCATCGSPIEPGAAGGRESEGGWELFGPWCCARSFHKRVTISDTGEVTPL